VNYEKNKKGSFFTKHRVYAKYCAKIREGSSECRGDSQGYNKVTMHLGSY